jgi:serine/threonine protein phosphatase 1
MIGYREIVADPNRVFVVGDIHGCATELNILLEHLVKKEKFSASDLLIFLGDYIDRGDNSKAVMEALFKFKKSFPQTVFLAGNHEVMMFACLAAPMNLDLLDNWIKNGGMQTLNSFGVKADTAPELMIRKLDDAMTKDFKEFLNFLERYVVFEDYCFVHAGVNPLRDLKTQLDQDIYWIRQEFINNIHYLKKTIVFGHTPFEDIFLHLPYKIGLDTGCVFGNMLSCLELKQGRVLQLKKGSKAVSVKALPEPKK